jgi:hypothetical protein
MRFDEYGYPCINGSSDSEDSSHLAGILAITEHPQAVSLTRYIFIKDMTAKKKEPIYQRCVASKHDFSRDQAWLLMVGLLKQAKKDEQLNDLIKTEYITGKDFVPPSLHGVETIAKRGKPYFWQYLWAKLEVYIHAKFQPLEEPFQTIAACEAYGLYKFWTENNKLWKWSIKRYLSELDGAWRDEKELCEHIINYVESRL